MGSGQKYAPSARKIKKAREQGDVPKSARLTRMLIFGVTVIVLFKFNPIFHNTVILLTKIFDQGADFNTKTMLLFGAEVADLVGSNFLKLFFIIFLIGVSAEVTQCFPMIIWDRVCLKLSRLNLINNLKRIIGFGSSGFETWNSIVGELFRVTLVLVSIGGMVINQVWRQHIIVDRASKADVTDLMDYFTTVSFDLLLFVAVLGLVYGACDYLIQRHSWKNRMQMDREELKKEFWETEGNPEIISMRKHLHQELLQHDILQNVKRANVLVVNK